MDAWAPEARTLTAAGARLHVVDVGTSTHPVVFVTDPPNVVEHYGALVDAVAHRRRVVVFEPPGFGRSTAPEGFGHTLDEQAAVVVAALEALGGGPFVLAFPCLAGLVALRVAAEHPALVSHLVLPQVPSGDQALRWASRVDPGGVLARGWLGRAVMRVAARPVARRWYGAALAPGTDPEPYQVVADRALAEGARFPLASALQGLLGNGAPRPQPVPQPALVVWGAADRTHRRTDKQALVSLLSRPTVVTFDEAGHFPELEAPERFAAELERFLQDTGS